MGCIGKNLLCATGLIVVCSGEFVVVCYGGICCVQR
jgi:hypothetical protein